LASRGLPEVVRSSLELLQGYFAVHKIPRRLAL
jgi:hypothetical protein